MVNLCLARMGKRLRPLYLLGLTVLVGCDLLTALVVSGCDGGETPPDDSGGVVFQFKLLGDDTGAFDFRTKATDPTLISAARAQLQRPVSERNHINGPIARTNGGHNLNWNWHFKPDEWFFAEFSIELCDGTPDMVDADLDYWVDTVQQFCPWASYVASEVPSD